MHIHHPLLAGMLVCFSVTAAHAQPGRMDLTALTLEQLLEMDVISSVSKFPQEVTRAPASVTVVTGEEIRHHGYRTLADVLGGVRGLYTTYDRNYSYVGVRGHARPGDYNTRVLLLVDGHRLNETTYDMAPVGTDFPIDVSLIERVEVIRGPGSSLYGTNAFFGVINVITKTAATHEGTRVEAHAGSLTTRGATVSFGRVFAGGNEVLLAATRYDSGGNARLHYPELEVPGFSDGIARDMDSDASSALFGSASLGRLSIRGAFSTREKQVPTASFGTVLGSDERTTDTHAYAAATYDLRFGAGWTGVARLGLDYYGYGGTYPYDWGGDDGVVDFVDGTDNGAAAGELTLNRRVGRSHMVTVGGELRRVFHDHQWARDGGVLTLDEHHPATAVGIYVQDEVTVRSWMLVNGGLRLDRHDAMGAKVTPRVGLVLLPRRQTAVKLLHGRAFRAPNTYELYYYSTQRELGLTLRPERIASSEIVWEEYIGGRIRTGVSAFKSDTDNLLEQRSLGGGDDLYYENSGGTTSHGIEGEMEGRWAPGFTTRVSHAYVRASDAISGQRLSNSPRHLSRLSVITPIAPLASTVAFEGRLVGQRLSVGGEAIERFFVPRVTSTTAIGRRLELQLSLHNVFNHRYADPGAEEHTQSAIAQDGRTFRARVAVRF